MIYYTDTISAGARAAAAASQASVTVALTVAAIGAFGAIAVGLLNYRSQRQGFNLQRQQQTQQFELVRSTQIMDRFTKAIDQLGNGSTAIRIGGIFALELLARDSPDDRRNVAFTLATFIREAQPTVAALHGYVPMLKIRAPDVQVAMTVLGRSPLCDERLKPGNDDLLDLSRTDLRRASLSGAHLERINFWASRLDGANLRGAYLQGAVLSEANLGRFNPESAKYQSGADLSDANLTGAQLVRVVGLHEAKTSDGTRGLPTS
jgi:Pentapeptide repeats (8 copies)